MQHTDSTNRSTPKNEDLNKLTPISASIVTYNTPLKELEAVVSSVRRSTIQVRLLVVDNSTSDTLRFFLGPETEYLHQPTNPGYGAAHNVALRRAIKAKSRYHFILNPDIRFEPHVLEAIIRYMDDNPDVGYVLPRVVFPSGDLQHLCKLLPHPVNLFLRRFPLPGLKALLERLNRRYELRFWDHLTTQSIPILSGCFMALRVDALKQVGLFDERFFMYLEDYDLMRRLGQVSKTVYFPEVTIIHDHKKESFRSRKLMLAHVRSAVQYFNKWGWFFDRERRVINRATIRLLTSLNRINDRPGVESQPRH